MANWTKKEYAVIAALEEQAISTTTYSVSCAFCDDEESGEECPSSAAEIAFKRGCTIHTVDTTPPESYVICKDCREKEAWKEWLDEEEE